MYSALGPAPGDLDFSLAALSIIQASVVPNFLHRIRTLYNLALPNPLVAGANSTPHAACNGRSSVTNDD